MLTKKRMQKAVNDAVFWGSLKKATLNIEIKNIFLSLCKPNYKWKAYFFRRSIVWYLHRKLVRACQSILQRIINPLSANPTKWPNIVKQFFRKLPTNCLSVFGHFVKLALKGLRRIWRQGKSYYCLTFAELRTPQDSQLKQMFPNFFRIQHWLSNNINNSIFITLKITMATTQDYYSLTQIVWCLKLKQKLIM